MSDRSVDDTVHALANPVRRELCRFFVADESRVADVDDLLAHLAEVDGVDGDRDALAVALHHTHLPKLVDAGIVDHDRRDGVVRYRGHPLLERLLRTLEDDADVGESPTTETEFRRALETILERAHDAGVPVTGFWDCPSEDGGWEVYVKPAEASADTPVQRPRRSRLDEVE